MTEGGFTSSGLTLLLYVLAAVAGAYLLSRLIVGSRLYLRFRGKRLVNCPETKQPAAVDVAAWKTARQAFLGSPHLRLEECSRWPQRLDCGQECLRQVEAPLKTVWCEALSSSGTRARRASITASLSTKLTSGVDRRAALLNPQGETVSWGDVPSEKLPGVFTTCTPVCWACHMTETFRYKFPELVTDRQPSKLRHSEYK